LTEIGAKINAQFNNQDTLQKAWTEAQQVNENTSFSERYQNVTSAVQAEAARVSTDHNDSFSGEVSSGLAKQDQYRDETQASFREVDQWQHTKSRVDDQSFNFQGDVGMAVRKFMIGEERYSPAEVDNIIHRHNMGDTDATSTLSDSVSRYAEIHGKELSGIQTAPDTGSLSSAGEARENNVKNRQAQVTESNNMGSEEVHYSAQRTGIPDERNVSSEVATLMDESGLEMDTATQKIDSGRASLSSDNKQLDDTVTDKQQIYSVGSVPGIHESMDKVKTKLTNKFSDLLD